MYTEYNLYTRINKQPNSAAVRIASGATNARDAGVKRRRVSGAEITMCTRSPESRKSEERKREPKAECRASRVSLISTSYNTISRRVEDSGDEKLTAIRCCSTSAGAFILYHSLRVQPVPECI